MPDKQLPTGAEQDVGETEGTAPEVEEAPEPEVEVEAPATEGDEPEDRRKPSGDSPQAVRARKEYLARQKAEQRAEEAERRLAQLQNERQAPGRTKILTPREVWDMAEEGKVKPFEAINYITQYHARATAAENQQEKDADERTQKILNAARDELQQYLDVEPEIATQEHKEFPKIKKEYDRLVNEFGYENSVRTELLATRHVLGPLEQLKQRKTVVRPPADEYVVDRPGRRGGVKPKGADGLAKVPKHFIEQWNKEGMTKEQMLAEAKYIPKDRLLK